MGKSLLDQLKQSGLVDKSKAQKVKHSQYQSKKQKAKSKLANQPEAATLLAKKAQAEKAERDRRLNLEKKAELERRAIAAQIRQLIEMNRLTDYEGDIGYNFTDANVVKRLSVNEQVRKYLIGGRLAIAKLDEGYALVPMRVAEKISQRDAGCIIRSDHDTGVAPSGDDPYADYQIPDDLMW